jgi:hypothetical protein
VDDRTHVTRRQPMLRQIHGQRHAVKVSNHTAKGYAVGTRGTSPLPLGRALGPRVCKSRAAYISTST